MARTALGLLLAALTVHASLGAQETILSSGDIKNLNKKAADWIEAKIDYEAAQGARDIAKARRRLDKEEESFQKEWDRRTNDKKVLASLVDLRQIFGGTFPRPRNSGSGEVKITKGAVEYAVVVPRGYREREPQRCIIALPGYDTDREEWQDPKDYYSATWDDTDVADGSIIVMPKLDSGMELDQVPDLSQEEDAQAEIARLSAVLQPMRVARGEYNLDWERYLLDAGKGASGFALRFATYFPEAFSGLVLRDPMNPDLRLGSLTGTPVLIVYGEETKTAAEALAKRLNDQAQGSATLLEGKGGYPFAESKEDIAKWAGQIDRDLNRSHIVVEPNHPSFGSSHWVKITSMGEIAGVPDAERPRLEVKVDREANRISVTSHNVNEVSLLLNDEIVDLDRKVTFEINGKVVEEEFARDFEMMAKNMLLRQDPGYLFTAATTLQIPREEKEDDSGASRSGGEEERPR